MEEPHPLTRRKFTGRNCELHPDRETLHAITLAIERAEKVLSEGRLLSPVEAMALALGEARDKETLFSLARDVALETGTDQGDILCRLGERFPDFA
jgi:hypothetical protein